MNPLVEILKSCGDLFAHCLVIVDLESPERELIYVNDNFCELSGYKREEVIGRNCRFLQGEGTSVYTVDAIRSAIKEAQCCFQDILNFKKNGVSPSAALIRVGFRRADCVSPAPPHI